MGWGGGRPKGEKKIRAIFLVWKVGGNSEENFGARGREEIFWCQKKKTIDGC